MTALDQVGSLSKNYTALVASLLVMGACGQTEDTPSSIFVGELSAAAPTSIAILADGDRAAIYVCDGVDTSAWYFGTRDGDTLTARADDGSTVKATLIGDQVRGLVTVAGQGTMEFSAPLARGAAGIYLVEQTAERAGGFSAAGGEIEAAIADAAVRGTVTTLDGSEVALAGSVQSFGEPTGVATWIVQPDGRVSGRVTKIANTTGGGNCSVWSKIKQLAFGVDCTFF